MHAFLKFTKVAVRCKELVRNICFQFKLLDIFLDLQLVVGWTD